MEESLRPLAWELRALISQQPEFSGTMACAPLLLSVAARFFLSSFLPSFLSSFLPFFPLSIYLRSDQSTTGVLRYDGVRSAASLRGSPFLPFFLPSFLPFFLPSFLSSLYLS